ncbi:MAG: hypothetical protein IKL47_06750 [Clostridia bacterium]|nr:hypothetical protein [Clostridia bacterium]
MKQRYWDKMTQFKFEILLFNEHFSRYVLINRVIIIVLAVLSSGAVGTWAIWKQYDIIWAVIVATTQIISIVNEFLPYKKRIEEIPKLIAELNTIYNKMEEEWYNVDAQKYDDANINKILYKYIANWDKVQNNYLKSDALPDKKRLTLKASELQRNYFSCFLIGDVENETEQTITQ